MWKKFRRHLEYAGLVILYAIGRWLPWPVLRFLGEWGGDIFYFFDVRSRKVAMANLELAFPDLELAWRKTVARRCFGSMAFNMLEVLASERMRKEPFESHFIFSERDLERFHELQKSKQGVVLATFHIGNWEWFSLGCALKGLVADVVAQQIKNKRIDALIRKKRESLGHRILYAEKGALPLLRSLKEGRTIGLLVDLNMRREKGGTFLNFFGTPVMSTIAAPALARATGSALLVVYSVRQKDGRYRIVFNELTLDPTKSDSEIAQQILDLGESAIRENPDQWIWMYKRWKFRPKGASLDRFPFYSYELR